MSKESAIIFLGIFIVIIPFLGFPDGFRTVLFVATGILVSFLALLVYAREKLLIQKKTIKRRPRAVAPRPPIAKPIANEVTSLDTAESEG